MAIELVVPTVGESVTEVQIGTWLKSSGDFVEKDEPIVEIESDKATVEVSAPEAGTVGEILKKTGEEAKVGDVIGYFEAGAANAVAAKPAAVSAKASAAGAAAAKSEQKVEKKESDQPHAATKPESKNVSKGDGDGGRPVMPAAARVLAESGLDAKDIEPSGKRLLKEDVKRHIEKLEQGGKVGGGKVADGKASSGKAAAEKAPPAESVKPVVDREEETVPMSPMRKRIAEHLVQAQQTAALLTTFNEIDMSAVMALRSEFKTTYEEKHGVKLGFMSFFVKASIEALKAYPQVNAEVRGTDIVYKNYYDIGIAVGGGKGLVVPVLRNAERMGFAEIESAIGDFGKRAAQNKIGLDELKGGTFTISNGGIYGSLMSTPIVNPPQSGILGMHKIEERPVVRDGQIVIRPMMYVAMTYDHRIVDGREAVQFLVRIKECIEDPARILLEV